jgi:mannitol-1-phosphate/altronate dehydrogenase
MKKHWACKFYLHNTPHAAAAFLGKLCNVTFIHESMKIHFIEHAVESIMNSIKEALISKKIVDRQFAEEYSKKEIERFKDELLFDPISRVGRDPLRKLRKNDRLIQAFNLIKETGQDTRFIVLVIKATLYDAFKNYNHDLLKILNNTIDENILNETNQIEELNIFNEVSDKLSLI